MRQTDFMSSSRKVPFHPVLVGLFLACSGMLVFPQSLSPKHRITHEDIWLMKRVGAPVPSPDGKWVVFSVTEPAYEEKDQASDLWIVPGDGSAKPRRLTHSQGAESGAAWSPDSRKLAFTAKREGDEVNQAYVMDLASGGEAMRVTSLSTAVASPGWSPDGKMLLFASTVFPEAMDDEANRKGAAERKARKYKARVYEGFPIRRWDKWLDDTQIHLFVQSLDPPGKAKDLLAGTKLVAEPGFAGKSADTGQDLEAIWAPDGQSIIFTATKVKNTAAYARGNTHLYQVSIQGGEPKQLTTGSDSYARPAFLPDGKALYFAITREGEKVYNLDRLARLPWPQLGQPSVLSAAFDRSVGNFAFSPDSRTAYLLAEEAGYEKLFFVPAQGGEVRPALEAERGAYTNLAIPGKASSTLLLANWESAVNPAELVRIDPSQKKHLGLTSFNSERAAAIDWEPVEQFWFTSQDGRKIHSMLALPPELDRNRKYPLLVLIHGGPHSMWRDQFFLRWNYHLLARPGYVVLLTNYTGSTGFGEKFAQDIQLDPFGRCSREINEAADEAIQRYPFIDGNRQAAAGASYGGHLTNWLQATTSRYRCLVSHAGLINLESQWGTSDTIYLRELNNGGPVWEQGKVWREQNPIRYAKNFRTPMLLTVGENDFRVPLNQTLENWSVLQRLRIPSRLIVFPEENHWIQKGENSRFFYQELHAWLKKYLSQ
ncbi:MAG: S9 family peptidase [Acidobacteria bacterium]|nr:S9 family peptidase [Acidobacteriota bacterium]